MPDKDDVKVGVGGDNKRLKSALQESRALVSRFANLGKSALGPFEKSLKSSFDKVFSLKGAIATLAGTGGLGLLVTSSISAADAIGKTASRIGVGVEAYQELVFAAREAGVEQGLFTNALTALVRRSGEAINGNKGFAQSFADLGITIEDLRSLRPEQLLGRVADGVKDLGSQAEQIAALDRVMSEAGRRMFNFTNLGSDGIERLRQEARDLGVVLDSVMVREAERAGDQLGRVGNILRTNLTRAVLSLTPQLIALAEGFTQHLQPAVQWLIQHLPDTAVASDELRRRLGDLETQIESLAGMGNLDFTNLPDFSQVEMTAEARQALAELFQDYIRLGELLIERERKEAIVEAAIQSSTAAQTDQSAKIKDVAESLQFEIDQLGRSEAQQRLYSEAKKAGVEVHGAFAASIEPLVNRLAEEKAALEATTAAAKDLSDAEAERARLASTVFEQTRTPMEKYQARLVELNDLQDRGLITWETYGRAVEQAHAKMDKATDKTGTLADAVKDLGEAGLQGNMQTWDDWTSFVIDKILQVTNAWVESQLTIAQTNAAGGAGGGGFFNAFFGSIADFLTLSGGGAGPQFTGSDIRAQGSFANGGNPPVGRVALVGERGPELFVPRAPGTVIPAHQTAAALAGGGQTIVQVFDQRRGGAAIEERRSRGAGGLEVVKLFVRDEVRRNIAEGEFGKEFGAQGIQQPLVSR